ncbi:MAG: hypothetical protein RDV41_07595, partial [Planctomycetota bacterium]|nr:hypothetical protein [Planctomycetota bacterium]
MTARFCRLLTNRATAILVGACLLMLCAGSLQADIQNYNLPSTSFVGWQNDACATVDRGTPTAGLVDTGSWTDTLPAGSTVTNVLVQMRAVYDGGGSSMTVRVNGTVIGSMTADGGTTCDNNSYLSVNATPGTYNVGAANTITLTCNPAVWTIWDRDDPGFGYVRVQVTYYPPLTWDAGAGTTNWSTATNWSPDGVPTQYNIVTIPNIAIQPTLTAASSCKNLTINVGANLSLSNQTLSVYGDWTNNGTLTAGTGAVSFVGAADSTIAGSATTSFYYLYINKSAATNSVFFNVNTNCTSQTHIQEGRFNMSNADTTFTQSNSNFYIESGGSVYMDAGDTLNATAFSWYAGSTENITGGTIEVHSGGTTWTVDAGGDFTPTGGTVQFYSSSTYGNAGTVSFYDL